MATKKKAKTLTITCESPFQGCTAQVLKALDGGAKQVKILDGELAGEITTVLPGQFESGEAEANAGDADESEEDS